MGCDRNLASIAEEYILWAFLTRAKKSQLFSCCKGNWPEHPRGGLNDYLPLGDGIPPIGGSLRVICKNQSRKYLHEIFSEATMRYSALTFCCWSFIWSPEVSGSCFYSCQCIGWTEGRSITRYTRAEHAPVETEKIHVTSWMRNGLVSPTCCCYDWIQFGFLW